MGLLAHQRRYQLESSETFITAFQLLFATISQASLSAVLNPSSVNGRSYFKLPYQRYPVGMTFRCKRALKLTRVERPRLKDFVFIIRSIVVNKMINIQRYKRIKECRLWYVKIKPANYILENEINYSKKINFNLSYCFSSE